MNAGSRVPRVLRSGGCSKLAGFGWLSVPSCAACRSHCRLPRRGALSRRSRRALLVLWFGILALAMHALVGIAHLGARGVGEPLALQICTHSGIVRIEAPWLDQQHSKAPDDAGEMHCCDLCGVRCMAMIGDATSRAVLTLVFEVLEARAPPPDDAGPGVLSTLTSIVPRAPPANA